MRWGRWRCSQWRWAGRASHACAFDKKIFSFESSKAERRPPRMRMTVSNIEMPEARSKWRCCATQSLAS